MQALNMGGARHPWGHRGQRVQRGMSLVELMVGITIGLFIVSAATFLAGNQLTDNRRLLLETQLQQDMRASMDIITRQLRRAGSRERDEVQKLLAGAAGASGQFQTDYVDIEVSDTNTRVTFDYFFDKESQNLLENPGTNWGFEAQGDGRLLAKMGSNWQELTDSSTMKVTRFQIQPSAVNSAATPCPNLCADGSTACWPKTQVRSYRVLLEATAVNDPAVKRSMQSTVRVRNNLPVFANGSTSQACP